MPTGDDPTREAGAEARKEFCRWCRLLYERHLVTGVGGNVSARWEDRALLTPSGWSLRDVTPDALVTAALDGKIIRGGTPTKDAALHLGILRSKAEATVVFHVHGASIVAASTLLEPGPDTLPPLTPGFVYFAHPLPMLPFMVPGTGALARAAARTLSPLGKKALLLKNHGLITVGRDYGEAMNIAEEIDEAARIFLLTGGKGTVIDGPDRDRIA